MLNKTMQNLCNLLEFLIIQNICKLNNIDGLTKV